MLVRARGCRDVLIPLVLIAWAVSGGTARSAQVEIEYGVPKDFRTNVSMSVCRISRCWRACENSFVRSACRGR